MKVQANTIRPGHVIEHGGKQWSVLKINILQPGKGGAFVQVEMRDVKSGVKSNDRFRTQETVEKLMVDEKACTYLYRDETKLSLMDTESYEQFEVDAGMAGTSGVYLQDGMTLNVDLSQVATIDVLGEGASALSRATLSCSSASVMPSTSTSATSAR